MRANALFHVAERRVECREVVLAAPGKGEVLIKSRCSAISSGTEAMIFSGAFPKNTALDASIESLKGGFDYPFSYGYALVGEVSATGPGVDRRLDRQDPVRVSSPSGLGGRAAGGLPQDSRRRATRGGAVLAAGGDGAESRHGRRAR